MIAVVVVRDGTLPAGAAEAIAECAGRGLLVGTGTPIAADRLGGLAASLVLADTAPFRPGAYAAALAGRLAGEPIVVLPASADGRDLAPRLAHALHRPLYAQATRVEADRVEVVRAGGQGMQRVSPGRAFVATLVPGVRGVLVDEARPVSVERLDLDLVDIPDATPIEVIPPDPSTIDLAEAERIVGGGAGLDAAARFSQLGEVAAAIGASVGATRVITDRHWVGHERQIGTTGVVVAPQLYLAFGVSGAVQHTAGLGHPEHIVAVNTDPHCPMMQMADLAVVADANATLDELCRQVGR